MQDELITRLKTRFSKSLMDDGFYFIGGDASVVVGDLGLTVCRINKMLEKEQVHLKANQRISLIGITQNDYLHLKIDGIGESNIDPRYFKGYYENR